MNILHNIYSVGPGSFGLGSVALNLIREQGCLGYDSRIWCLDNEEDRRWAAAKSGVPEDKIQSFTTTGPGSLGLSFAMEKTTKGDGGRNISIVHQHALWKGVSRTTNILRQRYGTPTIVAPHGSLEEWALKKSWWKKRVSLVLYERENLQRSSCLHACSHQEVAGFREFGLANPVAVIPNGIGTSWLQSEGSSSAFRKEFEIPESKRILLYLSRIAPIKGLPMLMEALGSIRQHFSDWVLVLAGADEFGHLQDVQKAVSEFGLQNNVVFTGLLKDQLKRDAFAAADVFVLPTLREAAPVVVLEALGAGVPVITTRGAPWQDLVIHECGWWTDISANALASALLEVAQKSPAELNAMGERGRTMVSAHYSWEKAARMTIELYEWLLEHRERPAFVVTD